MPQPFQPPYDEVLTRYLEANHALHHASAVWPDSVFIHDNGAVQYDTYALDENERAIEVDGEHVRHQVWIQETVPYAEVKASI